MNRADFEKAHQAHMERQRLDRDRRRADTWGRANASGPPPLVCDECGRPASFGRGFFGRPNDNVEAFCSRHAPESLKRPGDFLPTHQQP